MTGMVLQIKINQSTLITITSQRISLSKGNKVLTPNLAEIYTK